MSAPVVRRPSPRPSPGPQARPAQDAPTAASGGAGGQQPDGLRRRPRATVRPADSLPTTAEVEHDVVDGGPGREARREGARRLLGVTGEAETLSLRPLLAQHRLTLYPVAALGLLGVVDTFQANALTILVPEVGRTLGVSLTALAGIRTLSYLATILAPLPVAALSQGRARRALLCIVTGVGWSAVTLLTGYVTSLLALAAVLVVDGLSTGSVQALHAPLLSDGYPPQARLRVLSGYQAVVTSGLVLSPLLVALLSGPFDLSWRGVFIVLGAVSLLSTAFALGLRDPGAGHFDTALLRSEEHERLEGPTAVELEPPLDTDDVELGFFEIVRRLLLLPTVQRMAVGYFVVGILLIPFQTFLSEFLADRWELSPAERGVFFAGTSAVAVVMVALYGRRGEREFAEDPGRVLGVAGTLLAVAVVAILGGSLVPVFAVMTVLFALGLGLVAILTPALNASLLSIVDARYRPHAAALIGIFTAAGSLLGLLLLGGVETEYGTTGSLVSLIIPGIAGALIIRSARTLISRDLDRMIDEVLETEDIREVQRRGGHLPMLTARGVNFSYGQLQVLFDVDMTVDDGEMVALLGTNGAGKSTLLKVVSGIGLPSGGSVRFRGQDITYLDAERRVNLGITQVPGGRAVFGTMDVVENLRTFAYTLGRDKKRVDALVDECFEAFPRLYERRSSLAVTMSGGEQQMLGLSRALILRPRLLLIDELSLGLAPIIVGQLLDMVRRINAAGTAVVLVEQSVNIALSLVDHAYFMEKGQVRFDGPAADLLAREDLLRAVFLEGAEKGRSKVGA